MSLKLCYCKHSVLSIVLGLGLGDISHIWACYYVISYNNYEELAKALVPRVRKLHCYCKHCTLYRLGLRLGTLAIIWACYYVISYNYKKDPTKVPLQSFLQRRADVREGRSSNLDSLVGWYSCHGCNNIVNERAHPMNNEDVN